MDDEPSIPRIAAWLLSRAGYRVLTAGGAQEALDRLTNEPVDLMVTDLYMPGQSGIELAAEALRTMPGLRLLLCTGFVDPEVEDLASSAGFRGIVPKPFDREGLERAVRDALDSDLLAPA